MNLYDTDVPIAGWILLLTFLAAGVYSFLGDDRTKIIGKTNRLVMMITGVVALLITLFAMLAWGFGDAAPYTTFGMGIYLSFLTSIALIVVPFVLKENGEFEMPTKDNLTEELSEMKDDLVEEVKEIKIDIENKIDGSSSEKKTEDKTEEK